MLNVIPDEDKMKYQVQLKKLLKIPKIEQKSQEWYKARNNLITASDFAQALGEGKFGTQRQLIEKKVEVVASEQVQIKNPFFEWGNLFEPVACNVYSAMHDNITVHEFGLLPHPSRPYFGASPDGISEDGVMLEIKCPFKRKITGDVPMQYYYQIQGQLDVCNLDHCDYFECEFQKFQSYEDYSDAFMNHPDNYTGVIEKGANGNEYNILQKGVVCDKHQQDDAVYWILVKYNLKRVLRDKEFVETKLDCLKTVWDKIVMYRNNPERFELEIKKKFSIVTEAAKNKKSDTKTSETKCLIVDLE